MLEAALANQPLSERIVVRFGATLLANLVRAGLSFASGILIARGLGASGYGDLNFLLGTFAAISLLVEMGTSSAFFTFISRRPRGPKFFVMYGGWVLFQFIATVIIVGLLLPRGVIDRVWVGHDRGIVLLAFAASFLMTQAWGMLSQLGEAVRKTMIIQVALVSQAIGHLALIAAAAYWGWLTLQTVMWLLIGEYGLLVVVFGPRLLRANVAERLEVRDDARTVAKEFATYCAPLVLYGGVGFLHTFADRWLLQEFGGAQQQGFFAIGQQFANISLIATSSILKVFWKEIAEARERQNYERVRMLYASVSRGLYFAGAWMSCLLIPYSREILKWTVGAGYDAAAFTLGLMFLYPIHQSLGQITGTFFYASGETGTWTRIGLIRMGVSIPVTYLILASPSALVPGLGLAAVGLALKMVVLQVIFVNLQAYVIARNNGLVFEYGYQVILLGALLGLGWITKAGAWYLLGLIGLPGGHLAVALFGSILYAATSLVILYQQPALAGLTTANIKRATTAVTRWLQPTTV